MNKMLDKKININSPLVRINKAETTEKIIIFFKLFVLIIKKNKLIYKRDRKICKLIEEICPQAYMFKGKIEKINELSRDNLCEKKF